MKNIEEIIQSLETVKISNELLYNIGQLENALNSLDENEVEVLECILTPYYVKEGKRLELYAYELNIKQVEDYNYDKHLLELTGKEKIEDIPFNIIERQKNCYIEILKGKSLEKIRLQNYINYLYSSLDVHNEVKDSFGSFAKEQLYFELY